MHLRPLAGATRPPSGRAPSGRPSSGRSGAGALDVPVRWVAVSELADPTPYLEGGELLLTTGMRMAGDLSGYVARLVARGVAGLGFGVGVSHEEVPAALIAAAEEHGLPLLEVPRETPFIAVGKAVSELLAAEQYEEITRAFDAQGRLTRAALQPEGMHAVIDRLAREVGGWAALLDESGEVRHATRGARTGAVSAELGRLRGTRHQEPSATLQPPAGFPASLALSGPGEHIVVQPVGGGVRPRGFLAVGAEGAYSPITHTVINAAGSLLTLAMEQGRSQLEAERRVHAAVLRLLLEGAKEQARVVVEPLGRRLPEEPLVVLATGPEALDVLETHAFAVLHDGTDTGEGVRRPGGSRSQARSARTRAKGQMAIALVAAGGVAGGADSGVAGGADGGVDGRAGGSAEGPGGSAGDVAVRTAERVAMEADVPVGVSLPCGDDPAALRSALGQARRALEAAEAGSGPVSAGRTGGGGGSEAGEEGRGPGRGRGRVVRFAELAGQGLLGLLDQADAQAFSAALLAPLAGYGSRAGLVESLRAYLENNGHWDAAAQRLGVHRHTLRYRMKRVAELLGRDLDDPGVRAELWFALEAARR
ncbi:PucR family transcriptional regulator [Nonomuraea sp. B10E15]|uniref:PucR family transcriptional regulator n=1 Tax=Nonomuraea sp. B10E15 TaxID=3153560 RepID=UPI00325F6BE4